MYEQQIIYLTDASGRVREYRLATQPLRVTAARDAGSIESSESQYNYIFKLDEQELGPFPIILTRRKATGELRVSFADSGGNYTAAGGPFGVIPMEWRLEVIGGVGIFGHNERTRELAFWKFPEIGEPVRTKGFPDDRIGREWRLRLGHFVRMHALDILGRNEASGELRVWMTNGRWGHDDLKILSEMKVGQIGIEWNVQPATVDDAFDDLFGYNQRGTLYWWPNNRSPTGTRVFGDGIRLDELGDGWTLHSVPSANSGLLVIGQSASGQVNGWHAFTSGIESREVLGSEPGYVIRNPGHLLI